MTCFARFVRLAIGASALLLLVSAASPSMAQQINPTASAVKEQQLLQELNRVQGRVSIPDQRSGVLEQPAGREWREFRNVTLRWIGSIAILGMLAAIIVFYLSRGMVRLESGRSGRTIVRFSSFERFVHWMTAVSFIVLGITGLNITFGRSLLLPWMGPESFSTWSEWAKYAHNYLSFAFTAGVILLFLMWIGQNFPAPADAQWLKQGGGMFDKEDRTHPPAWKFNAGQKILFWLVILASSAMIASGFVLMFPFYGGLTIGNMEWAEIFHGSVGVLFVALILAHIYLGTIGMEGAFDAMGDGNVDLNWAKEHHSLWVEDEVGRAQGPTGTVRGVMRPAE